MLSSHQLGTKFGLHGEARVTFHACMCACLRESKPRQPLPTCIQTPMSLSSSLSTTSRMHTSNPESRCMLFVCCALCCLLVLVFAPLSVLLLSAFEELPIPFPTASQELPKGFPRASQELPRRLHMRLAPHIKSAGGFFRGINFPCCVRGWVVWAFALCGQPPSAAKMPRVSLELFRGRAMSFQGLLSGACKGRAHARHTHACNIIKRISKVRRHFCLVFSQRILIGRHSFLNRHNDTSVLP